MGKNFKLALIQMLVKGGRKEENLCKAEELIFRASEGGAQLALLPECLDLGWTHPSSQTEAEPIPDGSSFRQLSQAAKKNNIYICAGLTEKVLEIEPKKRAEKRAGKKTIKIFNTAVLIDNRGEFKLIHRKLNELEIGHEYYNLGDRINVVKTEFGVIGLMICADAFAEDQVISRSLCYMGADLILSPSSWAVSDTNKYSEKNPYGEIWRKNYGPVSEKYGVWIAGVSNVGELTEGPWAGRTCIGSSLVFDAEGKEVLQGPYGADAETIIYVDIKPKDRPFRGHDWLTTEK
jgi:predicted amidohydrolase